MCQSTVVEGWWTEFQHIGGMSLSIYHVGGMVAGVGEGIMWRESAHQSSVCAELCTIEYFAKIWEKNIIFFCYNQINE